MTEDLLRLLIFLFVFPLSSVFGVWLEEGGGVFSIYIFLLYILYICFAFASPCSLQTRD